MKRPQQVPHRPEPEEVSIPKEFPVISFPPCLLAGALLTAGQPAEAVTWFGWVLAGCADVLGPDHPATLAAPISLGRALVTTRSCPGSPGQPVTAR
jgi:hypothetical protein